MKSKGWKEGHKYWGLTPEQIKAQWNTNKDSVAGAGTDLHYEIECFNNKHESIGFATERDSAAVETISLLRVFV